ncbi:MAG TPA: hypothetical protein VMW54_03695 [Terriglobia bacterium]|nr:hypothetical protein [Terriglobia bacterium]
MAEENPYDSTSHLVGHLIREIESALRYLLRPITEGSSSTEEPPQENKSQKEVIKGILGALEIPADHQLARKWLAIAGKLDRVAHRRNLFGPRELNDEFMNFWADVQTILDLMLAKVETRFLEFEKLMQGMLAHAIPTEKDLKILKSSIPYTLVAHRHFFRSLKSPLWLAPLRSAGFLKEVPTPIQDEAGIAFPIWPPGEYLERVAAAVPDVAYRVIMEAPNTDNIRAHDNFAEIATALPANQAAEWAAKEAAWIAKKDYLSFGFSRKLGKLVSYMATAGKTDAALMLAESLLTVMPDPKADKKAEEDEPSVLEPRVRFDLWEYEQVLKENVPDLLNADGGRTLSLLCDLLDRAVALSQRSGLRPPEDFSYIWRPAIEDHEQNLNLGLKQILVTTVRDAARQLANKDMRDVPGLVGTLEERGRRRRVFSRLALYLLWMFPEAAPELVAERLTTHALFSDVAFRHEYFLLAQKRFGHLAEGQQSVILGWIEKGPDIDLYKKWQTEATGKECSDEQAATYRKYWQLERLTPLAAYLQGQWKDLHHELVADLGEPEHPEFSSYTSGGFFGPTSPETEEDLGKMSIEDLVSFLKSWQPSGDRFREASPEGLGRQLASLVASKPDYYSEHAQAFELEEPTYVRGVIQGFWDALKQDKPFAWEPALNLCKWAVGRKRDIPGRTGGPLEESV